MSAHFDNQWRGGMKPFLLNESHADVHFLVGIDDVKERLPAHKVVLSSASEVFNRQLDGHFKVPEPIVVEDTTPEVFKLVLSYIYTDEVELTPDNAFPVLYLAQKYLLNNLLEKALKYISSDNSGESVAKVLPHLHLVNEKHAKRVWEAIDLYADAVLKSPEFLELSHSVLCDILRRDGLNIDELSVYNGVVAWAHAECQRKERTFAADAREVLGDALKLIRFPSMSADEFVSGPADSSFLSDQEKLELNKWYGVRTGDALTTFSSAPRKRPMLSCTRLDRSDLTSVVRQLWPTPRVAKQGSLNFSVNTRIRFRGVAFYGRRYESRAYEVNVSLLNAGSGEPLATTHANVDTDGSEDTYAVLFDQPVMIAPRTEYKITAVSVGPHSIYAKNGRREVRCDHGSRSVTFDFMDTGLRSKDEHEVSLNSRIPVIYLSFP